MAFILIAEIRGRRYQKTPNQIASRMIPRQWSSFCGPSRRILSSTSLFQPGAPRAVPATKEPAENDPHHKSSPTLQDNSERNFLGPCLSLFKRHVERMVIEFHEMTLLSKSCSEILGKKLKIDPKSSVALRRAKRLQQPVRTLHHSAKSGSFATCVQE